MILALMTGFKNFDEIERMENCLQLAQRLHIKMEDVKKFILLANPAKLISFASSKTTLISCVKIGKSSSLCSKTLTLLYQNSWNKGENQGLQGTIENDVDKGINGMCVCCRGRRIAKDIARGLNYLHQNDICHLDVKSPNVLLSSSGAKIGDVGLGCTTKDVEEGKILPTLPCSVVQ